MDIHSKKYLIKGIMSVISAFLHQFSIFPLFMMSNIMPFMTSYLYQIDKKSNPDKISNIRQSDGYFIHPIMSLSMSLCCFFGGIVEHYLGPRLVLILGGISIAAGDIFFILSRSLIADFFINIFFGIGFGISMMAAVKNASKYFPERRGLINAIAGGFGGNLGSSSFNLVIKYFVSKGDYPNANDNYMYNETTASNYKIFFGIHACVVFSFGLVASLLLMPYENAKNEIKDEKNTDIDNEYKNIENENNEVNNNGKNKNNNYKANLKIILKNMRIYYILLIFLFTSFLQGFILTVGFNFGTMNHDNISNIISADQMSIIFMLMSLISCFIGPIFGMIYDKLGFKITIILINIISMINGLLIFQTVRWSVIFYGFSIILNGCINSGAFSLIFPYVSKIFGFAYAGELYGIVVLSTGISSIISSSTFYIIDKVVNSQNDKTYLIIFIVGVILNAIAGILTYNEKNEAFNINNDENMENEKEVTEINKNSI